MLLSKEQLSFVMAKHSEWENDLHDLKVAMEKDKQVTGWHLFLVQVSELKIQVKDKKKNVFVAGLIENLD